MAAENASGMDLITLLSIVGIIFFLFIFPERWAEKIENMFGEIISRPQSRVIDVEKIAKSIRKTPER